MTKARHSFARTQKPSATDARAWRSFLLMRQFAAKEIGARISEARRLRGMTQDDLAEALNVSKRSVQDYEGGTTIPYKHFQLLGTIFDRDLEWFLYGEEPEPATSAEEAAAVELRRDVAEMKKQADRIEKMLRELLQEPRQAGSTRP